MITAAAVLGGLTGGLDPATPPSMPSALTCDLFRIPGAGCAEGVVSNWVATVGGLLFVAVAWKPFSRWWRKRRSPVGGLTSEDAAIFRRRVLSDWVEPRFQHAVGGKLLKVPIQPAADLVDFDKDQRPIRKVISDFEVLLTETKGRLLVVGGPGSGKTVYAMQIARVLVEKSQGDSSAAVPMVLSVSSFDPIRHSDVRAWIGASAERLYGVKAESCLVAFDQGRLALVLDGLDELFPSELRVRFLDSLNVLLVACPSAPVVLTCREDDLPSRDAMRARLRHAVVVRPLTQAQIGNRLDELAQGNNEWGALGGLLRANEHAMAVLSTPLYLDLLSTVGPEKLIDIATGTNPGAAERAIASAFVTSCTESLGEPGRRSLEKAATWLSSAKDSDRAVLYIDEVRSPQFKRDRRLVGGVAALVVGLLSGLAAGLVFTLLRGLVGGLVVMLSGGLLFGFSWIDRRAYVGALSMRRMLFGLPIGLAFGLIYALLEGWIFGLQSGLVFGLAAGLLSGLARAVRASPDPTTAVRSSVGALPIYVLAGSVVCVLTFLQRWGFRYVEHVAAPSRWVSGLYRERPVWGFVFRNHTLLLFRDVLSKIFAAAFTVGPVTGLYVWLNSGGWFAVNQWSVARSLRRQRLFPGGLVPFLDRAVKTGIMRRVGPGWQFRHRAIQDLLAASAVERAQRSPAKRNDV
jgi:tetrahydromethanopterin S-methyltransferase subunit F